MYHFTKRSLTQLGICLILIICLTFSSGMFLGLGIGRVTLTHPQPITQPKLSDDLKTSSPMVGKRQTESRQDKFRSPSQDPPVKMDRSSDIVMGPEGQNAELQPLEPSSHVTQTHIRKDQTVGGGFMLNAAEQNASELFRLTQKSLPGNQVSASGGMGAIQPWRKKNYERSLPPHVPQDNQPLHDFVASPLQIISKTPFSGFGLQVGAFRITKEAEEWFEDMKKRGFQ